MSHIANKYLIKRGRFIRNFDQMYKKVKDPWNQKKNNKLDIHFLIIVALFKKFYKKGCSILDVGAAGGYLKEHLKGFKSFKYLGTDISKKVAKNKKNIIVDDIRIFNKNFVNKFDFIFILKTIYYVSPEINKVIKNLKKYLKKNGILIISYNLKKNSFTNKYLTDAYLRKKLKKLKLVELYTIEVNREIMMFNNGEKHSFLFFKKKN